MRSNLPVVPTERRWAIVLLALGMLTCTLLLARQQPAGSRGSRGTLYLVGYRHLSRLDLGSNLAKEWKLLTLAGLEDSPDCSYNHVPMSCDWSASEARLDLRNQRLYFVTPAEAPGDEPESEEEMHENGRLYSVWAIDLDDMKVLKRLNLPLRNESPTIILSPDGKQLLVSARIPGSMNTVVDTFDTATFAKISTIEDSSGDVVNTFFSTTSYFVSSGKLILHDRGAYYRIRVESGKFKREDVDPRTQLPPSELKKLSGFVETAQDGQRLLLAVPVSSRNEKTLVSVANRGDKRMAFWTVDMETGTTSPAVIADYSAKANLIGSGNGFVAFEGQVSKAEGKGYPPFVQTGRVVVYDVKSGAVVREFNKPELKGEGSVLCLSPDGSRAAYARGHDGLDVLTLDFRTGNVKRVATVTEHPELACGFAE